MKIYLDMFWSSQLDDDGCATGIKYVEARDASKFPKNTGQTQK
jgi:hypothetical protein